MKAYPAMSTYLTLALFRDLTVVPASYVDEVQAAHAGWVDKQLDYWSRWIDSRLRKRYASPFAAHDDTPPTPVAVQGWLERLVTARVMLKRGVDQNDEQVQTVLEEHRTAKEEILEAARSDENLFDLPLRTDGDASAINRGGPKGYSEQSPYVFMDEQAETAHAEDRNGGGTVHG